MAFPTTGILDNFNRDDEGPPPSASWANITDGLEVIGSECAGDQAAENISYWNVATFGADCECYASIVNLTEAHGVWARMKDVGASNTLDGYWVRVVAADTIRIYRVDDGSATQLGADVTQTVAAGDKLGIECVGDQVSAYFDDGGAGWGAIGVRTDATYGAAGYIGANITDTSQRLDDFGGGTVVVGGISIPVAMRYYRNRRVTS